MWKKTNNELHVVTFQAAGNCPIEHSWTTGSQDYIKLQVPEVLAY